MFIGSRQTRLPDPFGPAANGLIPFVSNGDLYTGDPLTGETRGLLVGPEEDFEPSYSPDGTRVAFLRSTGPAFADGTPAPVDIYTMRDDGTNVVKLTTTPINSIAYGIWAPDSRRFAVTYWDGAWNRMIILDADGLEAPTKVALPTNPVELAFRPLDGQELLFRGKFLYPDDRFGLYVMNTDGTNIRTLVEPSTDNWEDLNNPTYSADGTRIYYQRWFPDSIQLWVMDADGRNAHEFRPEAGPGWDGMPSPSPDGQWIAWWHVIEDGRETQRVAVARADGTGDVILTGPELTGTAHWVWSPDSTTLLMYPDDDTSRNAYLLDPQGGPATTVPWLSDGDLDWQRRAP